MVPQRFFMHGQRRLGDRHVYAQRTRFIPTAITKHFKTRFWPRPQSLTATAPISRTPIDVKARLREMWVE
jgi:DNA helicase-2/ATP-dependent DNA helicase PcrA